MAAPPFSKVNARSIKTAFPEWLNGPVCSVTSPDQVRPPGLFGCRQAIDFFTSRSLSLTAQPEAPVLTLHVWAIPTRNVSEGLRFSRFTNVSVNPSLTRRVVMIPFVLAPLIPESLKNRNFKRRRSAQKPAPSAGRQTNELIRRGEPGGERTSFHWRRMTSLISTVCACKPRKSIRIKGCWKVQKPLLNLT